MPETDATPTPQPEHVEGGSGAPTVPQGPATAELGPVADLPKKKRDFGSWFTVILVGVIVAQFVWVFWVLKRNMALPANQSGAIATGVRPPQGGPPMAAGPRFPGPQGTGAPGEPGPPLPRFDLQEFAGGLVMLQEAGIRLSAGQRTQCLELLRSYQESARKAHDATTTIYRVLTAEQRRDLLNPKSPSSPPGSPMAPGRNYMVEGLVALLETKAAAQGAQVQPETPSLPMPSERFTLLNGLTQLASAGSLTAEQARTTLDAMKSMRDALFEQYELETQLAALLTPEQRTALASKDVAHDASVTAWLVARYLERK